MDELYDVNFLNKVFFKEKKVNLLSCRGKFKT